MGSRALNVIFYNSQKEALFIYLKIFIECILWTRLNPSEINKSKKEYLCPYANLKVYSWGEDDKRDS